ncbi:CYFA0S12e02124g1_1 [Cyberlindnera fabianii]|uniref:Damage-regulated import facilitator 1 n=1 Tax=Cyberlindnera fabianii TaxID=36022 RepID=A0A061B120_CYBFA|nr:Damage-regulated import facilitator 1 [Cyberlindnera fabianii]CDR43582.1 CYFA0S12e02124g1_1 [Cyberlindnera fabianii]
MAQVKRQLNHNVAQDTEAYDHQYQLQTIGMRIRKAVSEGYQTGDNVFPSSQRVSPQPQTQSFQRVPLPSNVVVPPMLSNATSSSFGSSMAEWENNLDVRLQNIENVLSTNKEALSKRRFDAVDNDW